MFVETAAASAPAQLSPVQRKAGYKEQGIGLVAVVNKRVRVVSNARNLPGSMA